MFHFNSLLPFYVNNCVKNGPDNLASSYGLKVTPENHISYFKTTADTDERLQNNAFLNYQSVISTGSHFYEQPRETSTITRPEYSVIVDDISDVEEVETRSSNCSEQTCVAAASHAHPCVSDREQQEIIGEEVLSKQAVGKMKISEERQIPPSMKPPRKANRKQEKPRKSAVLEDPKPPGIIFSCQTKLVAGQKPELVIAPFKSWGCSRIHRRLKRRHAGRLPSSDSGSSDIEPPITSSPTPRGKQCASCGTRKTPLWRDAEDGTPLCNACGIRYKKYKIRCTRCWNIPKKDSMVYPRCSACGSSLRYAYAKKSSLYY